MKDILWFSFYPKGAPQPLEINEDIGDQLYTMKFQVSIWQTK